MLAVDSIEFLGGLIEAAGIQIGQSLVIKNVCRFDRVDICIEIDVIVLRGTTGNCNSAGDWKE